ncbi:MAG: CorA family divalent cation transporter [Caulobacteraceae bacterium]|nr:CorA family divalent cation transporter [Caulobacteraceae bacterium]
MTYDDLRETAVRPGLVWGFDFAEGRAWPISEVELLGPGTPRGFRWLHFNLADQRTARWLAAHRPVSAAATELLLSTDNSQRAEVEADALALVLHDFELDFIESEPRVGVLRIAASPSMIVTARRHPLRCAEAVKRRLDAGATPSSPADALELIFAGMIDGFRAKTVELEAQVQAIEDELLKDRPATDARTFTTLRSLMVRMHRMFGGARAALRPLDEDGDVPQTLREPLARHLGRLSSADQDLMAVQGQLRLLRDEMDLHAAQQTNDNLYFLSILSALLLPATLVTGIFGMNTGGLPWTDHKLGSLWATVTALGSAGAVYLVLRLMGFIRR